ncbi:LysE family translocator [Rhodoferax antarcticus]|uniref:LysE family translocator n=1 Tax=Rhodoferax antarcticus TaxID=81479 RepID=UPI0022245645|nr:LysE family translocator [Rhodoferax antarcticus]MCW2314466.1 threonine/homoserine/homoserine lactone efflux protein [Rhodoferax antarcticus]
MSTQVLALLATVVAAHFLALISPGPDFLMIVRSSVRAGKFNAIGVAGGIALANGLYIALCIVGVGAVLAASLVAMAVLKVIGGVFLIYIAVQAIRAPRSAYNALLSSSHPEVTSGSRAFWREFAAGFLSGIANPKNIIFYLSLFSVVLTNEVSIGIRVALGLWMTAVVFVWDTMIVMVLYQDRVRRSFAKVAFYIDKISGALLGLVGLKLLHSALSKEAAS